MASRPARPSAAVVTRVVLLVLMMFLLPARAYDHAGITVAGSVDSGTDTPGTSNTSSIINPFALCADFNSTDVSDAEFLIGGSTHVFTFNRYTTFLNYWFGGGSSGTDTGKIDTVRVNGVYGCVTMQPSPTSSTSNSVVYYVQNNNQLYWVTNEVVFSTPFAVGNNLFDVAIFGGELYVLTAQSTVFKCSIGTNGTVTGSLCSQITLNWKTTPVISLTALKGFTVSSDGIYIAPSSGLYLFTLTGSFIAQINDVNFVDAKYTRNTDMANGGTPVLMAASTSAVYTITLSGTTLTHTLVSGTPSTSCNPSNGNVDSDSNPTFCGITRIFPITTDSVYLTIGKAGLVRAIIVNNETVPADLARPPLPLNFEDNATVMSLMLDGMNYELTGNTNIPYPYVAINSTSLLVNDTTWATNFSVDVSNRFFVAPTTNASVSNSLYSRSLRGLSSYYNRTNFVFFGDANVLPMCNRTKLQEIEVDVATQARAALQYPFIYTGTPYNVVVNGQPNLTLVKLLMPYPFGQILNASGFFANQTTVAALSAVDFNTVMLASVRRHYNSSRIFDAIFPGNVYFFNKLSAVQLQEVRWIIYGIVEDQLALCAANSPFTGGSSSSGGSSDIVPGCVARVGISNITDMPMTGQTFDDFNITVFVPESFHYNFSIDNCLNSANWTKVLTYLQVVTAVHSRKCDTGCIVGIAVASAVVTAVLVVVIIIVTSKRRRLATVVAPAATTNAPKFVSTVDSLTDESSRNPLNP